MRLIPRLLLTLFVCLAAATAINVSAQSISLNEQNLRLALGEKKAELFFDLQNSSGRQNARLRLELLAPDDEIRFSVERQIEVKTGKTSVSLPLEIRLENENLAVYRLRYRVAGENSSLDGIVAVSEIVPDVFEIEAAAPNVLSENKKYLVRVRAVQPVSRRGVSDVKLNGEIKIGFDGEQQPILIKAAGETDAEGFALLKFNLPRAVDVDETTLKITGSKNKFARAAESDDVQFYDARRAYLMTDKPLYQPGQMFRVRALFLSPTNTVVPASELVFKIKDAEYNLINSIKTVTSAFGVASVEWQIPENARLGEYSVEVEDVAGDDETSGYASFKVSRYELPNFVVKAKTDREFYLPENNFAEIEIRADYLFGQPVAKGKVRVVREFEREWNYQEQKYETKEGATQEGKLDASGRFVARFDLSEEHKNFEDSRWQRQQDISFTAYVTNFSTNRTEQRRFDVRLTKQPIHVYLIGETYNVSSRLAPKFYVSTFYADGSPASCDVAVYQKRGNNRKPENGEVLAKTRTNSFGAGQISLNLTSEENFSGNLDLVLKARDRSGKSGTATEDIYFDDGTAIQLVTDKTIYRRGEPVRVNVWSSAASANLFLDVEQNGEIIRAEKIRLDRGRAEVVLPYGEDFENDLTVAAYAEFSDQDGDAITVVGNKTVIFPKKSGLQIEAETAAEIVPPGAETSVNFAVKNAAGDAQEAALGVVVLDKAIEERARTDAEFGGRYRDFYTDFHGLFGLTSGFGGLTRRQLENIDFARFKPDRDLQLAAEIALRRDYHPEFFRSRDFREDLKNAFSRELEKKLLPARKALEKSFSERGAIPFDDAELRKILAEKGIAFDSVRDCWASNFRAERNVKRELLELKIFSNGADKKPKTADDLEALTVNFHYFHPIGVKLNQAVLDYNQRTNEFIQDFKTLREELQRLAIDFDRLRDPFGNRYRVDFAVEAGNLVLKINSAGANGKFENERLSDDIQVWANRTDYFTVLRANMSRAVSNYVRRERHFPADESEMKAVLKTLNFNLDEMKDILGRDYFIERRVASKTEFQPLGETAEKEKLEREALTFAVKSPGKDNVRNTIDDYELISFTGISGSAEQNAEIIIEQKNGEISGTITDPSGAVVPNATLTVIGIERDFSRSIVSNENGFFRFENLLPGFYQVEAVAVGFKRLVMQNVQVVGNLSTAVNLILEVGGTSATVNVMSSSDAQVNATESRVETSVTASRIEMLPKGADFSSALKNAPAQKDNDKNEPQKPIDTPRVREYFPETLVWQPELITDKNGRAELKFKFADSLTTWKMAVIGSTLNGEIGIVEKEFKTFQPFFAELDTPRILTEGDRIRLPVTIRNYLSQPQIVSTEMSAGEWFRLFGAAQQSITVEPNSASNAIFDFQATNSTKDGKQRVAAIGSDASDAIEKSVVVHPHGQEISRTNAAVFRESVRFDVNFPANLLPRTEKAELKIYPNLMSHVVESIEGILRRPYGCGEQTVSSTYPSLLVLKSAKNVADPALKTRAQKYLQLGYERLLSYRAAGGGFSYWGNNEANLALSAYALRFLVEAKDFTVVDEDLIAETREFLLKKQTPNGSWENQTNLTAYVARILTMSAPDERTKTALKRALAFLQTNSTEIKEPYILANLALASFAVGDEKSALAIAEKLKTSAKEENGAAFWSLEGSTPFYGWGNAGRIETTALVLQVLVKAENSSAAKSQNQSAELISKGLQFLLKSKDGYGVWLSTQTTINVLDTLIALIGKNENAAGGKAEIFVNGAKAGEFDLPAANELKNLLTFDLTPFVTDSNNLVEIRQTGNIATASAQIVQNYYVSWSAEKAVAKGLQLAVNYDKTAAAVGEEISCRVEVKRTDVHSSGMLLAEIGLPPGAEVSRESLQRAMETDWRFSRYDVLPDRVVVYLWASAEGNKFEFKFKPRYGIEAVTAPSLAYDYYNPDAEAVLAPSKFFVK